MKKSVLLGHVAMSMALSVVLLSSGAMAKDVRHAELGEDSLQKRTVTVYSSGFAHVQEDHSAVLQKGPVDITVEDVPQDVDTDSVALEAEGVVLKDMSFHRPPQSGHDYLQMAVGQDVLAVRTNPRNGRDIEKKAKLISLTPSPILLIDDKLEVNFPGRIVLPEDLVEDMSDSAEIAVAADVVKTAKRDVKVQYKLSGVQWQANYVASYDAAQNALDVQARIGVTNHSRTDFEDVALRVVSGQPNQARQPRMMRRVMAKGMMMAEAAPAPAPRNIAPIQSVGYHLYPVPGEVSLDAGEHKEIVFFERSDIPVTPVYTINNPVYTTNSTYTKWNSRKATLRLDVAKDKDSDRPALPSGVMRVVTPQADGVDMLLGEARVPHTSAGDELKLNLGKSVDVAMKSRQVSYTKVAKKITEHGYEVVLSNASDKPVRMELTQAFSGQWRMLRESLAHTKISSQSVLWAVEIPAKAEKTLTFKVQINR